LGAKEIVLKPIDGKRAREIVCRYHYSGKAYPKSQLHIGVFYRGRLEGAMQYGPPIDRRRLLPLVEGTEWHEFCELNRMAFGPALPRNAESRALSIASRLIREHAPHCDQPI